MLSWTGPISTMASSPRANVRHAHFKCDDVEDSGDDSSSGLQLRSRRDQGRGTSRRPPPLKDDVVDDSSALDGGRSIAHSNPVLTERTGTENPVGRSPVTQHEQGSDGILASETSLHCSSKANASRQRVRMNSTPVTVSMPLMKATTPPERSAGIEELQPRGSTDRERSSISPMPTANEPRFFEKTVSKYNGQPPTSKESRPDGDPNLLAGTTQGKQSKFKESIRSLYHRIKHSRRVSWIVPTVTNFNLMKPVIRSSVSAWVGLVFLLINPILRIEGQSAFFSVVVAFISPPSSPFVQAMEQIVYLWVFVGLAWAWVAICAACISAVRTNYVNPTFLAEVERKYSGLKATNPEQYQRRIVSNFVPYIIAEYHYDVDLCCILSLLKIFEGTYIQAKPAVLCAVFLAVGTAFLVSISVVPLSEHY